MSTKCPLSPSSGSQSLLLPSLSAIQSSSSSKSKPPQNSHNGLVNANCFIKQKLNPNFITPLHSRLLFSAPALMANPTEQSEEQKIVYSVWALPPEDVTVRIETLMNGLRSEFSGPQFEPHITVVGAIPLTRDDALIKFRTACEGRKAYQATVDHVATGTSFYQCVFLLIRPTPEVVDISSHCCGIFGYKNSTPYMPHLSLLYAHLSDEQKMKVKDIADKLDEGITGLSFPVTRLALYKTDTEDETLESWEKITEYNLRLS